MDQPLLNKKTINNKTLNKKKLYLNEYNLWKFILFVFLFIIFIFNIVIVVYLQKFNTFVTDQNLIHYIGKLKILINEACKDFIC